MKVREDLCTGCGLCERACPNGAISVFGGKAHIDEERCTECKRCLWVCPRGAVLEGEPVSIKELKETFDDLSMELKKVEERLEKLQK